MGQTSPRSRRLKLTAAVAAGAVVVGGAAAAVFYPSKQDTFGVEGVVTLLSHSYAATYGCVSQFPYGDVTAGAEVSITDISGRTVATGRLAGGTFQPNDGCGWRFSVPDVPASLDRYTVRVGAKVSLQATEAELRGFLRIRGDDMPRA